MISDLNGKLKNSDVDASCICKRPSQLFLGLIVSALFSVICIFPNCYYHIKNGCVFQSWISPNINFSFAECQANEDRYNQNRRFPPATEWFILWFVYQTWIRGVFSYKTKRLGRRYITCIGMHKFSIIKHPNTSMF